MVSLQSFVVGVNLPFIAPTPHSAYPIAILLHGHCAIYALPPTPLLYAIHHTILVMTVSCKGQLGGCTCVSESVDMDGWMDGYTDTQSAPRGGKKRGLAAASVYLTV